MKHLYHTIHDDVVCCALLLVGAAWDDGGKTIPEINYTIE